LITLFTILLVTVGEAFSAEANSDALKRSLMLRARIHLEKKEWNEAGQVLAELLEKSPSDQYLLNDLASVYRQLDRPLEADKLYLRLIGLYPGNIGYRQDYAYLLYELRRFNEAAGLIEPLLDGKQAVGNDLFLLLAESYVQSGQKAKADSVFERLYRNNPDSVAMLLAVAESYLGQSRTREAALRFRQVYSRQPDSYRALKGLGVSQWESEPDSSEKYLKLALPLDSEDFEVPYLLAELYFRRLSGEATQYYQAALNRLQTQKSEKLSDYQQSRKAWIFYRLGNHQRAEADYRAMIDKKPGDPALRNDLAEMLVAEKRYGESLEVLNPGRSLSSPGSESDRAALLRGQAFMGLGRWQEAAGELRAAVDRFPENPHLSLDYAEALEKSGRWTAAGRIMNEVLSRYPHSAATERAYEMRKALRLESGTSMGIELEHTGYTDGSTYNPRPFLRIHPAAPIALKLYWGKGFYDDNINYSQLDFSKRTEEYGLDLRLSILPEWDVSFHGRKHSGHLDDRFSHGYGTRFKLKGGGTLALDYSMNNLWSGPVDAVIYESLYDRAVCSVYLPFYTRFYCSGELSWRSFDIYRDRYFGEDYQLYYALGWNFFRGSPGASHPLRYLSLSAGYNHYSSKQQEQYRDLIELLEHTRTITVNLSGHLLINDFSSLDLRAYAGMDPKRDLGFAEIYGFEGQFHLDLGSRLSLFAGYFYASESILQETEASYKEAKAGLLYYF
jgi:predicted Zn-dependent protease